MLPKPFEGYCEEMRNAPSPPPPINVQNMNIGHNVLIDQNVLITELQNIDSKSDQDLYNLIGLSYNIILDNKFLSKDINKIHIAKALSDRRFCSIFCNVVGAAQLEDLQKIYCNKLIYDYFTSSNKDEYIINMLYNLGYNLNKDSVQGLYGKGLDHNLVTYLAVARRSTTDDIIAAKRVNVAIVNQPSEAMTEQNIVYIYEELFNRSLLALFEGIMFDNWYDEDDDLELEEYQEENYGTINLAILDIVNNIPTSMIIELLSQYGRTKQHYPSKRVRFDIHAISEDYGRILQAIQMAESQGIYVPH